MELPDVSEEGAISPTATKADRIIPRNPEESASSVCSGAVACSGAVVACWASSWSVTVPGSFVESRTIVGRFTSAVPGAVLSAAVGVSSEGKSAVPRAAPKEETGDLRVRPGSVPAVPLSSGEEVVSSYDGATRGYRVSFRVVTLAPPTAGDDKYSVWVVVDEDAPNASLTIMVVGSVCQIGRAISTAVAMNFSIGWRDLRCNRPIDVDSGIRGVVPTGIPHA